MRFARLLTAALAVCLMFAVPATAQRIFSLSYTALKLGSASRVNDITSDETNRVWFATDEGVVALEGSEIAPFFPLNAISDNLAEAEINTVTMGVINGQEHFFLGYPQSGVEYGRILSETGLQQLEAITDPELSGLRLTVNDMATDSSSEILWLGTLGGLLEFDLGRAEPAFEEIYNSSSVSNVIVAPWQIPGPWQNDPAVFFSSGSRVFIARSPGNSATELTAPSGLSSGVSSLVFDGAGNLWCSESGDSQGFVKIYRYDAAELIADPSSASATSFTFTHPNTVFTQVNSMDIDISDGNIWLGTNSGVFTQKPDVNDDLTGSWAPFTDTVDLIGVFIHELFIDPSGNQWFGTEEGVTGIINRLLTISSGRFVGTGAKANVTLEDLTLADNSVTDSVDVNVTVGTTTKVFTVSETADDGQFSFSFDFSLSNEDSDTFLVVDGDEITVEYQFTAANGKIASLIAKATWADIVEFEDDLWIGGPCFIETLKR